MPKIGLTQSIINEITPYLDERIVFNKLKFIESKRYKKHGNSLYLVFAAYVNTLDQYQRVSYNIANGCLQVHLHDVFIKPKK